MAFFTLVYLLIKGGNRIKFSVLEKQMKSKNAKDNKNKKGKDPKKKEKGKPSKDAEGTESDPDNESFNVNESSASLKRGEDD